MAMILMLRMPFLFLVWCGGGFDSQLSEIQKFRNSELRSGLQKPAATSS